MLTDSNTGFHLGYWHQRADKRHGNPTNGNQAPLVVIDKVVRPRGAWGEQVRGMTHFSLQCFDNVDWVTGWASGLDKVQY